LRWIAEGAILYRRDGLGNPPDVADATEQYRQESDRLKDFLEDRCIVPVTGDANSWKLERCWIPVTDLYPAYLSWAEATGDKHLLGKEISDEPNQSSCVG
jgi:putative DNA primase/helicase